MSENQNESNINENKVVTNNNEQSEMKSSNDPQGGAKNNGGTQSSVTDSNTNEKKSRKSKKDEDVVYVTIEEDYESIHVRIKRLIPKIIDEYVSTYKQPVRRSKLQDLVFGYDDKLAKFYEEQKEAAVAAFSFAITKLVREKKIVKVKDPDKKRPTYYILPKHVDMFKK